MMSAVSASNSLNVYMVTETLEYTAIKEITYVLQNLSEKKKQNSRIQMVSLGNSTQHVRHNTKSTQFIPSNRRINSFMWPALH